MVTSYQEPITPGLTGVVTPDIVQVILEVPFISTCALRKTQHGRAIRCGRLDPLR